MNGTANSSSRLPEATDMEISVVSPVYQGADLVSLLVERISAVLQKITKHYEILLVDDGSSDSSWKEIAKQVQRDFHVRGIRLDRNYGQHPAIKAGLDHARGKWIVVMDCDLQDVPEEIPNLYQRATEGYDCVFALRDKRRDPFIKRFYSWSFYKVLGLACGIKLDSRIANFGIYSAEMVRAMLALPYHFFFFPVMIRKIPARQSKLVVEHASRASGKTTYAFGKALRLGFQIIRYYSFAAGKPKGQKDLYRVETELAYRETALHDTVQ